MKRFLVLGCFALLMGSVAMAQTVTVSQAGGANFTSIQAAIDSINATNGQPDVVQILDGATYEEQVVIGGLPPIAEASGNFIGEIVAQNRDPFTLRGPATGEKPKIAPSSLVSYGVFEDDLGDNFDASLVYFGKDITIENVAVYQLGDGPYGVNAQGVDITFRNCLFQLNPTTSAAGEAAINFNNSDRGADYYNSVTNDVLFEDCVFDGEDRFGETAVYYHGNNGVGLDDQMNSTSTFVFDGCTFKRFGDDITALRARGAGEEDVHQTMTNCLSMDNASNGLNFNGGGTKVAEGCIFLNNVNGHDTSPDSTNAALGIRGRSGRTGTINVSDCIFSMNASYLADTEAAIEEWGALVVTNDGDDGPITIDHCTFDGNSVGVRFVDASARPRTATISNSIFSNNVAAGISGDGLNGSYIGHENAANLSLTIVNCLFHNNPVTFDHGTASGTIAADPLFANKDALAADPFALSDGSPAIGAALDGTDVGATQTGPSSVSEFMLY